MFGGAGRGAVAERLEGVGVGVVGLDVGLYDGFDFLVGEAGGALDAFAQYGVGDEDVVIGESAGFPHDGVGGIGLGGEGGALERPAHEGEEAFVGDGDAFAACARDLRSGGAAPNVTGVGRGALGLDGAEEGVGEVVLGGV